MPYRTPSPPRKVRKPWFWDLRVEIAARVVTSIALNVPIWQTSMWQMSFMDIYKRQRICWFDWADPYIDQIARDCKATPPGQSLRLTFPTATRHGKGFYTPQYIGDLWIDIHPLHVPTVGEMAAKAWTLAPHPYRSLREA